jgi:hypothetical protein
VDVKVPSQLWVSLPALVAMLVVIPTGVIGVWNFFEGGQLARLITAVQFAVSAVSVAFAVRGMDDRSIERDRLLALRERLQAREAVQRSVREHGQWPPPQDCQKPGEQDCQKPGERSGERSGE